ncbi:unnamed protein product, partial [Prorocentrum cordatum]
EQRSPARGQPPGSPGEAAESDEAPLPHPGSGPPPARAAFQPPRRGRPHHGLFATERGSPDAAGSSLGSSSAQELLEGCGGAQIALSAALAASRKADVRQEPPCTEPRRAARADRFARGAELRGLWSRDRFLLRAGLAKRPNSAGRRPGGCSPWMSRVSKAEAASYAAKLRDLRPPEAFLLGRGGGGRP